MESPKGMLRSRKRAGADLAAIVFRRLQDGGTEVGELFGETGMKIVEQPKHVVSDQNLAVAGRPRADADGWDLERLRDFGCSFGGNAFDDHGKSAGFLNGKGVFEQFHFIALDPEAAEA